MARGGVDARLGTDVNLVRDKFPIIKSVSTILNIILTIFIKKKILLVVDRPLSSRSSLKRDRERV